MDIINSKNLQEYNQSQSSIDPLNIQISQDDAVKAKRRECKVK